MPPCIRALIATIIAVGILAGPASAATPRDARAFVDTIGVNTHLH